MQGISQTVTVRKILLAFKDANLFRECLRYTPFRGNNQRVGFRQLIVRR
jgi:hypothetical protein